MSQIKFRAKIGTEKRIQIPSRLENFQVGDKVLVTIEPLPKDLNPSPIPTEEKSPVSEG